MNFQFTIALFYNLWYYIGTNKKYGGYSNAKVLKSIDWRQYGTVRHGVQIVSGKFRRRCLACAQRRQPCHAGHSGFAAVCFIGVVTFILSGVGLKAGSIFGLRYKAKAEIAGGIILILIGVKILLEHLGVLCF